MHNENEMTICYISDLKKLEAKLNEKNNDLERAILDIHKAITNDITSRISHVEEDAQRFNNVVLKSFGQTRDELEGGSLGSGIGPRVLATEKTTEELNAVFSNLKYHIKVLKLDELLPKINELNDIVDNNKKEIEKFHEFMDRRTKIFYNRIRQLDSEFHDLKKSLGK